MKGASADRTRGEHAQGLEAETFASVDGVCDPIAEAPRDPELKG
jgi:hypothetical protein